MTHQVKQLADWTRTVHDSPAQQASEARVPVLTDMPVNSRQARPLVSPACSDTQSDLKMAVTPKIIVQERVGTEKLLGTNRTTMTSD